MGCNAWNHSPDCNCGWGGQYHASYDAQQQPVKSVVSISPGYCTPFSLTKNAACPVCGAPVFFFSNENGSKVFFDSIGPPWPKHPCTDVVFQGLIRAAEISSAAVEASATDFITSTQLTPNLDWMDFAIVGNTHMVDNSSVVDVAVPYPGKMRMELLVFGHTPFILGSKARVLRLPGSKLHILHGMRPDQVLVFAVRSYSDLSLLSQKKDG